MNYENNILSILSFASTRATWVSVSSFAERCNIPYSLVWAYLRRDDFGQVAQYYRYDYRIRTRKSKAHSKMDHVTYYLSAVSEGYA